MNHIPLSVARVRVALGVLSVVSALSALSACAPLIVGGAALGSAMVATDRRSSGTQVDDQGIELKAAKIVGDLLGDRGHVSVTSYDRTLLITGEVPTEADKVAVNRNLAHIDNVHATVNELAVLPSASLGSRSKDTLTTSRVKTAYIDARDLQSNSIKVVTERGTVYLMGVVTEREAARAADIAAGVDGVQKVVRVFHIVSEQELANISTETPKQDAPAPAN